MTMLRAFVSFMLVASTSAIYNIRGHLVCQGTEIITTEDAVDDVWVELYYMERDAVQTYCTPFHVGGHDYDSADKVLVSAAKGLECINECILHDVATGDAIRAVTFYHGRQDIGCYCIKNTHFITDATMSTCNFKYTNDYMELKRAKNDNRVSRNGKQMISLNNYDNLIHLEGAAGRTDNALVLMVKVTNAQCQTAAAERLPAASLVSMQDNHDDVDVVDSIIMGVTNWGPYWNSVYCKDGITGFTLRVEGYRGEGTYYDDSALNGIKLRCRRGDPVEILGYWGNYRDWADCNHGTYVISFQLRSEANQGSGDDTAANNIRMKCSDGKVLDGKGGDWGDWEPYKSCPAGSYFCGIQMQIEARQDSGDDSAVNHVKFHCCRGSPTPPGVDGDVDLEKIVPVGTITVTDYSSRGTTLEMYIRTRTDNTGMWTTCNKFTYRAGMEKTLRCAQRTMARYIRIAHPSSDTFQFTVKVTEAKPNAAFRKPAKQASLVADVTFDTHEAGKAVDGVYEDTFAETNTFWRVDLKELITIDKIILYLDREFYRTKPFRQMKVKTNRWNLEKWTLCKNVGAELTFPGSGDKLVRKEVTCLETTIARAVRIENGVVRLHEVEILEANVVWFNTPYDCFDAITPQFGCKDLTFDLSTGKVRRNEPWSGRQTHEEAGAEEAERQAAAGGPVYYKIWNKMLDAELYAGYDAKGPGHSNRVRHARVHSRLVTDPDYSTISRRPDIFLWELVKVATRNGKDYYNIISKDTNGKINVPNYETDFDDRPARRKDHYAIIQTSRNNREAEDELWEIVKRADAYYTIVNKKFAHPLFAEHITRVADISDDKYPYNGQEIWDLQKQ